MDERQVVGLAFDADRVEAFPERGFDGCAAAGERVKN
jgi:hypothetical protein